MQVSACCAHVVFALPLHFEHIPYPSSPLLLRLADAVIVIPPFRRVSPCFLKRVYARVYFASAVELNTRHPLENHYLQRYQVSTCTTSRAVTQGSRLCFAVVDPKA